MILTPLQIKLFKSMYQIKIGSILTVDSNPVSIYAKFTVHVRNNLTCIYKAFLFLHAGVNFINKSRFLQSLFAITQLFITSISCFNSQWNFKLWLSFLRRFLVDRSLGHGNWRRFSSQKLHVLQITLRLKPRTIWS